MREVRAGNYIMYVYIFRQMLDMETYMFTSGESVMKSACL